jgi:lipoprotein-anchoring transpeptidase ErfK/SrfK
MSAPRALRWRRALLVIGVALFVGTGVAVASTAGPSPRSTSIPAASAAQAGPTSTSIAGSAPVGPAGTVAPAPPSTVPAVPPGWTPVARAMVSSLVIHTTPGGPVLTSLANPQPSGNPLVLQVLNLEPQWIGVALPTRPNGSTGWVLRSQVSLTADPYRLDIDLAGHRLVLSRLGAAVVSTPIAIGAPGTRTPTGNFFVTELIKLTDPAGTYGPFAFGISAHSDFLTEFDGGDGQIGIHGTDDPAGIGHDVSHGCVRLPNGELVQLVGVLPLGTPVHIYDPPATS